ncbi:hypothetical protein VPH5P1C_0018 [Vibrio phage 5P1c]
MATSQVFTSKNMNGNDVVNVGKIQVNQDAIEGSELVRKSQAETISATAVQAQIVAAAGQASETTSYSSEFTQTALDAKQDTLSIDSSSTQYLELVNGVQLKLKDLGIVKPFKDTANITLAAFIADSTFNGDGTITTSGGQTLDKMTFIFLQGATDPSEKAFVYLGTNAGTSDDFVSFSVDYNQGTIRSFFSGTGVGISYTTGTGAFALDFGNTTGKLGAHSIPVDSNEFSVVTGTTILTVLKALETYIADVDTAATGGTATVNTRLNSLSGVTGNNLTTFTQGLFTGNSSIKTILQESETLHKSATADRAAIRTEFASADSNLQSNLNSETATRLANDNTLQSNINIEASTRASADAGLQSDITNEAITRSSADTTLQNNIDTEESARIAAVAAESTARANADTAEANARTIGDTALQDQIDALAGSNIELVGSVDGSGNFVAVDGASDSRNGQAFISIAMKAGEVVIVDADVTLLSTDFKTGDTLTVKVAAILAGAMQLSDFIYQKGSGTDITRANLDDVTIKLDANEKLVVTPDSIGRTQLDSAIEADVDDKVSLTVDSQTITGKALKVEQSDSNLGSSYGLYLKKTQTGTGALTGTSRGLLVENWVESDGSGNAALPSYAHNSITTHYNGDATDMSVVVSGAYCEANSKATSAINAIGSYSVSTDTQLGVNIGAFAIAENAATSNVSLLAYASTDGAGADRGVVGAITNLDIATYSGTRVADPFPHNEVAVVADAKYAPAGSKALYAYGDVILEGGSVTVPSASADTEAVNLGDIKDKQRIFEFDLVDGVDKVITVSGVDLDNAILQTTDDNQSVDVAVVRDSLNNEVTVTATGGDLTDVRLLIQELSCSVTQA